MATVNLKKVRAIDWDISNYWDIKFPDAQKAPFNTFIPVIDVEITMAGTNTEEFGNTGYNFLRSRSTPTLQISFIDDVNLTLFTFFKDWIDDIIPYDLRYVKPIESAKKNIIINKLDRDHNVLKTWSFFIIPSSDITYHGTSDGTSPIYSLSFNIVGGQF